MRFLTSLRFVIAVTLFVPLKTVLIHYVDGLQRWLSSTLFPSFFFSPVKPPPPAPLGPSSAWSQSGEAGSAQSRVSGSAQRFQRRSLCFSSDKTLYILGICDLQVIFHCLKLQELVISPIIVVDFAVKVSRNEKNCGWDLVFCVERTLYYCVSVM